MNRLNMDERKAVVAALIDGKSISSTVRMTGVSKPTILKLFRDLGGIADHVWSIEELLGLPD